MSHTHAPEEQNQDRDADAFDGPAPAPADRAIGLLMLLDPGDFEKLASVFRSNPTLREELIMHATALLGSDTVGKALALLAGPSEDAAAAGPAAAAAAPTAPPQAPVAEGEPVADPSFVSDLVLTGTDPDGTLAVEFAQTNPEQAPEVLAEVAKEDPVKAAEVVESIQEPEAAGAAPVQAPEPVTVQEVEQTPSVQEAAVAQEPVPESGWITRARAYHADHAASVEEFNQATGGACVGPDGELDPVLVSRWQEANGVSPDGRVGPATLAAAKSASAGPERTIDVGGLAVTLE